MSGLKWLGEVLILPFQVLTSPTRAGSLLRWILHFLLLFLVLVALTLLNYALDLGRVLRAPVPMLRSIWLPLLFLLLFVLAWMGWWLWVLLSQTEEEVSEYPDIDSAWDEAKAALNEAGIDLTSVPLFLVLGRPVGTERSLMGASQVPLAVVQSPRRHDSPIYVYAGKDGIFVTCVGTSLLGWQSLMLMESMQSPMPTREARSTQESSKTRGPFADLPAVVASALGQSKEGQATSTMVDLQPDEERRPTVSSRSKRRPRLLSMTEEVERLSTRLRHLCRLISQDRAPYCPLNGILVLIPYMSTSTDEEAQQTGAIIRRDLSSIREVMKTHCPLFSMVCDMERAPGFREFLQTVPSDLRERSMGRDYPLMPDLERDAITGMIESGVQWICRELLRTAIYKLFRVEGSASESMSLVVRANTRLYELLYQLREREKRLSRLLIRSTASESSGPLLYGGCYLAATGQDPTTEQAFVPGVFRLVIENQNYVSWTKEATAEEQDFLRWTNTGYVTLGVVIAAMVWLIYTFWPR